MAASDHGRAMARHELPMSLQRRDHSPKPLSRHWFLISGGLMLLGALMAVATVLLAEASPLIDAMTPFTGHIWGFGVAGALTILAPRQKFATLVLSCVGVLLAHSAIGYASRVQAAWAPPLPQGMTSPFKVVALNTWHDHDDLPRLARFLTDAAADVVVLTEIGPNKLALLDELRATYPHQVHCAHQWHCSVGILSRHRIEAGAASRHGLDQSPIATARIVIGDGQPAVTIIGTHIHRPTRNPYVHATQMRRLSEIVNSVAGPVIVAGDLNAGPWSASLRRFRAETQLAAHARIMPTWPAWPIGLPQFAFDHVLASQEFGVVSGRLGPAVGSDHFPVIVELSRIKRAGRPPGPPPRVRVLHAAAAGSLDAAAAGQFLPQIVAHLTGEHHAARNLGGR